ncbi:chemotaxis protein CheD [Sulfitobacter sp. MF3-043]|uniref:chemotaxis protein CheD n=1 Tax=Sulfitobacter sediminivivens TaxID=3252902 RepID=UPI0036DF7CA0
MISTSVFITKGEYAITDDPDATISTLLGSCVACCLWDWIAGVGGMNHMLITTGGKRDARCNRAGVQAMELLVHDLLSYGAKRSRLQAKVFGGAQMVRGLSGIGAANCTFKLDYLQRENIPCDTQSLGGAMARQVQFWPVPGAARQRRSGKQALSLNQKS